MSDIGHSNWSETAASNNAAAPNGSPEGTAPSTINDTIREVMAATKRWWNLINGTITTSGTNTITAASGISAYVTGQRFLFKAGGTNTGATTLNVNGLGAKTVKDLRGNALIGGEIKNGKYFETVYDGTDMLLLNTGTGPGGMVLLYNAAHSGAGSYDFETTSWFDGTFVKLILDISDFRVATDAADLYLRVKTAGGYQADAADYRRGFFTLDGNTTAAHSVSNGTAYIIAENVDDSTTENNWARIEFMNPLNASLKHGWFSRAAFLDSGGGQIKRYDTDGRYNTAEAVTGLRIGADSGNCSFTLRVYGFLA